MKQQITEGLDLGFIDGLTDKQRAAIAAVIARASEKSYRRGFQQGATIGGNGLSLHDWRYGVALDKAPSPDAPNLARTSADILQQELPDIARVLRV